LNPLQQVGVSFSNLDRESRDILNHHIHSKTHILFVGGILKKEIDVQLLKFKPEAPQETYKVLFVQQNTLRIS